MTHIRVKGFQIFKDRHGRLRCYHRKTHTPIDVSKCPLGSAEFLAEYARINALAGVTGDAKPGTLGLLVKAYKVHQDFTDLALRTRQDYEKVFEYLRPINDTALVKFTRPLVIGIRDKAGAKRGRRFGNYVKAVLSILFAWGIDRDYLKINPAFRMKSIRRPKDAPQANRPWSDAEREAVMTALPAHMRLPVALMMYCGLDPQDAVKLPKTAIASGRIDTRRGKTKEAVFVTLPEQVKIALAAAPAHGAITLCANSLGKPWTVSGFRASWRKIKLDLEREGKIGANLTLKGLRHTVASILAEMGYDDRTIADMLGQKTLEMAQHYSKRADRSRKMTAVIKNFDAEVNERRMKVVKPE